MVATPPRICEESLCDAGMFSSADMESSQYCGVCATIGYATPFFGLIQKVGATLKLPESNSCRLRAMSPSLSPSCSASTRSTSTFSSGLVADCWTRASATPGTRAIFFTKASA